MRSCSKQDKKAGILIHSTMYPGRGSVKLSRVSVICEMLRELYYGHHT